MYKLETLIFSDGERYPLLINRKTGIPDFYSSLWVTIELRNQSAVNTIRNKLNTILWLMKWEKANNLMLSEVIKNNEILSDATLESLIQHMRINATKQKNNRNTKKKIWAGGPRPQFIDTYSSVSANHQYNRLTTLSDYILFLAKIMNISDVYQEKVIKLISKIKGIRYKTNHSLSYKQENELPDGLLDEFMSIANYSNPNNPFQDTGIRKRNQLMFILLRELGIRRGELLSIQIPFIDIGTSKPSILIRRTHDDKLDTRKVQAVSKTRERRLPISHSTAQLINDYIMNFRSKIPYANKHPYLFVTHRKGKTQGHPISTSSFDNIIVPTMKRMDSRFSIIHPHIFRHAWNLDFSRKIDKNNNSLNNNKSHKNFISPEKEAKIRQDIMGHSSEKSGNIYNQRYIREKANQISLEIQTEFQDRMKNYESSKNC
ncbi:site-specific integrase [Lonepinella sp. BR2271]|uniref:site-specific integrase n=1 Tax=Lonepinella sp. BR2271 TaxID=3434550 RepID=UPI003F6DC595